MNTPITPELLLAAYASGYFPMAQNRNDPELHWFSPEKRGIIPLDDFHIPKSLAKFLKKNPFEVSMDRVFRNVITACAEREETWINDKIIDLYCELHQMGHAHSVECWHEGKLVGGLYGVSLGGAFFGESMFSHMTNASKTALAALVDRLKETGYQLLDTQYVNDHLKQFGVIEVEQKEYLKRLEKALLVQPKPFS